jgi:hypothetical protein
MTVEFHMVKQKICSMAAGNGWKHLKTQEWCINFEKIIEGKRMAMNVFWNKAVALGRIDPTFTVQTSMNHPHKGKTQLNRAYVNLGLLNKIFENPRVHTKKGYY